MSFIFLIIDLIYDARMDASVELGDKKNRRALKLKNLLRSVFWLHPMRLSYRRVCGNWSLKDTLDDGNFVSPMSRRRQKCSKAS